MREKQRATPGGSEGQLHAFVSAPVDEVTTHRPALVIDLGRHGITRRARRQHVGDETLVPAADLVVDGESVGRTPVPGEYLSAALGEPAPFRLAPQPADALTQAHLLGYVTIEVGARTQQSLEEERALHEIRSVVLAAEGHRGSRVTAHEVRIHPVEASSVLEAVQHEGEARQRLLAA